MFQTCYPFNLNSPNQLTCISTKYESPFLRPTGFTKPYNQTLCLSVYILYRLKINSLVELKEAHYVCY